MIRTNLALASLLSFSTLALAEPSEKGKPAADGPGGGVMMRQQQAGGFQFTPPQGVGAVQIQKRVDDDNMTTVVTEDDREITITQNDDDGIKVSIKDGNAEPRDFAAKDADALKAEAPEAFEVYNRYCVPADQGGGLMILGHPAGGQHMIREFPMGGGKIAGLDVRCEFMPNPALRAQLGDGVVVTKVKEGGRGAAMGLREFDYIKSINGTAVGGLEEAQALIKEADKLSIEVLREGKTVTLAE